jgi:hypothetical protein
LHSPLPTLTWARAFGGSGADEVFDVALDGEGAVLAAGYHSPASDAGAGGWGRSAPVPRSTEEDALAWKLSAQGSVAWVTTLGGVGGGMAFSTHVHAASGEVLVGGFTAGLGGAAATFGAGAGAPVLRSRGSRDAFVTKARTHAARMRSRSTQPTRATALTQRVTSSATLPYADFWRRHRALGAVRGRHVQRRV